MTKQVNVCIPHPRKDAKIQLKLSRDFKIGELTELLYKKDFLQYQKPGYRYILKGHLLAETHSLNDYLDVNEDSITISVFDVPTIMV